MAAGADGMANSAPAPDPSLEQLSFAEVMACIQEGRPIPGCRRVEVVLAEQVLFLT